MMPYNIAFALIRENIKEVARCVGILCVLADELPEPGRITDKLRKEIWNADICLCDLTGCNPNVVWELGYAQALARPCICLARSSNELFFDIKDETTILYNPTDLSALSQKLTDAFEACIKGFAVRAPEDLFGTEGHEKTTRVLAARRVTETPYTLLHLIERAKDHIFIAAQNHFYWVESSERQRLLKDAIEKFLNGGTRRRVDILLCDNSPEYKHAVRTWQYVGGARYSRDLDTSIQFFRALHSWSIVETHLQGALTIKKVEFVPTSMTFVDPDEDDGMLVLTPNGYEQRSRSRPCFVVSRRLNGEIFMSYWAAYSQRFNDVLESNISQ